MELILFTILIAVALTITAIGLFKPEHTEMALIGFLFLFLLALSFEAEGIDYADGTITNSSFYYSDYGNYTLLNSSNEQVANTYTNYTGGNLTHIVGYYMIIMSIIGFVGVLVGLRKERFNR